MRLNIHIDMNNAAFGEDEYSREQELAEILNPFVGCLKYGALGWPLSGKFRDSNGNIVGTFDVTE